MELDKESKKYAVEYKTLSGFTLEITPLPPYYLDIIEDLYPLKDYPEREIPLLAGDTMTEPYKPTDDKPDPEDEDYELWIRWYGVDRHNKDISTQRIRVRRDLLMSLCLSIKDGPVDIADEEWTYDLEAPFADVDFHVPVNPGQRKLLFIKYIVIRDMRESQDIIEKSMFPEVSMEGVGRALQGFQGEVGQDASGTSTDDD